MHAYFVKNPSISVSYTNKYGEWAQSGVASIIFDSTNSGKYGFYFKSTRAAKSSAYVSICGNGSGPTNCSGSTTSIAAGYWYKVSTNVNLTYNTTLTSYGTVEARNYEEGYYGPCTSESILKIDTTPPSASLSYSSASYNGSYLLSATAVLTCSDGQSGVKSGTTSKSFSSSGTISTTCTDNVGNSAPASQNITIYEYSQSTVCGWNNCLTGSNTCAGGYDCPSGYDGGGASSTCSKTSTTSGSYNSCHSGRNTCQGGWSDSPTGTCSGSYDCGMCDASSTCKTGGGVGNAPYPVHTYSWNSCKTGSNTCSGGYDCPSGYSGGGSSSTCSKTDTTSGTYNSCHTGSNTCAGGYNSCWHTI